MEVLVLHFLVLLYHLSMDGYKDIIIISNVVMFQVMIYRW